MDLVSSRQSLPQKFAALAFAIACAASLGACSSSSVSSEGDGDSGAAKELVLAVNAPPASLDPTEIEIGQQGYVWGSLYDTLLYLDNDGKLQPNAAESWQVAPDGIKLTLTLRKDLTFSDGSAVTATDVKGTLERTRVTAGRHKGKLASVQSIETPDERTVVLNLSQPDPALPGYLAQAVGVIAKPSSLGDAKSSLEPVASGPYVLDKTATVNGTTYALERREGYWNAKAFPFKEVRVRVIPDRTAVLNALQSGELNAGTVEPSQKAQVEAAGLNTARVDASSIAGLFLVDRNGALLPPLSDVRVRKAINMAFDREKLVSQVLKGVGQPTVQNFNPKGSAYDQSLAGMYPYDPEKARALLKEAGYEGGFTMTMPSTVVSQPFEPLITQALSDIGITVAWEPVPPRDVAASMASKKFPAVFFIDGLKTTELDIQNTLSSSGFLNPFGTKTPELTGLMDAAGKENDPEKAARLEKDINKYAVENAYNAPLFFVGTTWATAKGIKYLGDGSNTLSTIRAFDTTN